MPSGLHHREGGLVVAKIWVKDTVRESLDLRKLGLAEAGNRVLSSVTWWPTLAGSRAPNYIKN